MKLLLLGGSGQLSARLAQLALEQGHEVWTLTRGNRPSPEGAHALHADRNDEAALRAALQSAHVRWDAAIDCICMNADHARIDLAVLPSFVSRLAVVSTDSVYHPQFKRVPQDEDGIYLTDGGYGARKREMEQVFEACHALDWTIFRPGHIFGPGFRLGCFPEESRRAELIDRIRMGLALRLVGGGEYLIHPIYVDDLALALLSCLPNAQTHGQIYCIGGPDVIANRAYYECIGRILGREITVESIAEEGYLQAHPECSGHLCHRSYTLQKLQSAGVRMPCISLEEGLRRHMEWLTAERRTHMKTIHLAGGCYWGVEKYMQSIPGVIETEVGFANGDTHHPTYQQVRYENTGHAETVRVVYDESTLPLDKLLRLFWRIIDPVSLNKQGEDEGTQYRTGVYHTDEADAAVIREELAKLQKHFEKPLAVEACPLQHFYPAEEYHQKYLDKNPAGYCHVPWAAINAVKDVNLADV